MKSVGTLLDVEVELEVGAVVVPLPPVVVGVLPVAVVLTPPRPVLGAVVDPAELLEDALGREVLARVIEVQLPALGLKEMSNTLPGEHSEK